MLHAITASVSCPHDIDLIVMGAHGHGTVEHMFKSAASQNKVVRKAPCPVLTVRDPEREFTKS